MRRRTDLSQKLNNVLYFLSGVLAVVVVGIIFINIKTKASETVNTDYLENQATKQENSQNQVKQEKWQEGVIEYKGEKYKYFTSSAGQIRKKKAVFIKYTSYYHLQSVSLFARH